MALHRVRFALLAALCAPAFAQETVLPQNPAATEAAAAPAYTPKGADTCLMCHGEGSGFPVLSIFKTPHGQRADSRTPFAGLQCESCHGPGDEHTKKFGEADPPIVSFGAGKKTNVAKQNGMCLTCHKDSARSHWPGSSHETADVPCASCHTVHVEHDPVLTKATEPQVCASCHTRQHAESQLPSAHPVRYGQMACSECHAVHGTADSALLRRGSVNETCYTCHAEKRGPFLWEHAPVAEDCTQCHRPHGSPYPALLAQRPPLLCQQCHSQAGHPSVAYTPDGLPSGSPSGFLLAGSCTNCHSQVHGSNHPSGAKLLR